MKNKLKEIIDKICRKHNLRYPTNDHISTSTSTNIVVIHVRYHINKHGDCLIPINLSEQCIEKYDLKEEIYISKIKINRNSDEDHFEKEILGSAKIILTLKQGTYTYKIVVPFVIKRYHKFTYCIKEKLNNTYFQSDMDYYNHYGFEQDKYYLLESIDYESIN